ncbi:MAG: DMT family transporter [Actinomycetota bacterium]|nr:DMT family transporter [Actinomycetota bacterium]
MVLSLAIASALALGVADYLGGVTLRRDGRDQVALTYAAVGALIGVVVVIASVPIAPPDNFASSDVLWSVAAGVSFGLALPLLMIGMARGPIAVVAPVLGLVSLAVPAIVGPILGDQLSGLEVIGLLLALPATVMVAASPQASSTGLPIPRALLLATVTGALLGSAAVFFGQTSQDSGVGPAVVAQVIATVLIFGMAATTGRLVRPTRFALRPALLVGVLSGLAVLLSVLAYQRGPVAIVAAVIGLAPGPTIVLAWLLVDERISRTQAAGFVLGVAAVVLFAFG